MPAFRSSDGLKIALLGVLAVGLVAIAVVVGVPPLAEIRAWVTAAGGAGPVLYAALYAGLSLTPAPASVLSIGGGVLFGLAAGLPVVMAGAITGAVLGFGLARRLGRDGVERFQARAGSGRLARFDALLRRRGILAVIGVRLAPVAPFALVNMACGLTALRFRDYVIGSAVGMLPAAAAFVAVGAYGGDPGSAPFLIAVAGLAVVLIGGAVLARRHRTERRTA
jgi:uncharacterized membrane protein YdjX (TVP38/TMEM64 family)